MKKQKKEANVTKKNLVKLKRRQPNRSRLEILSSTSFDTGSINDGISISVCY